MMRGFMFCEIPLPEVNEIPLPEVNAEKITAITTVKLDFSDYQSFII